MQELLKQGDFVIVWDSSCSSLVKGIVIQDEVERGQIYVVVIKNGMINQNYYDRNLIAKVS